MARIVILGCAGTGKTTLARQLGGCTSVPVISLDAVWQPHWTEKNVPAFRRLMQEAHAADNWISDGNFAVATFDIRLPRATQIVWLEASKLTCSWRVIARVFKPGEAHRVGRLAEVLLFVWRFNRINRPRIEALIVAHGRNVPVRRLKSRREIAAFLKSYRSVDH